jgi:hypothetical protein
MKKILLVVVVMLLVGSTFAWADGWTDFISKQPNVKEGVAMALTSEDTRTYSTTQVEVLTYKDLVCINLGVATNFSGENLQMASASLKLGGLDRFGIKFPLSDWIQPEIGGWAGKDFINTGDGKAPWTGGIQASIIRKSF